jgi:hypothetical protein
LGLWIAALHFRITAPQPRLWAVDNTNQARRFPSAIPATKLLFGLCSNACSGLFAVHNKV